VVRRIVEPKILGDAVGIGALSALISLYVGYQLVGVVGVFLGPIVIIVFTALRKAGLLDFKIKLD
jgi:predicted PurR-regulated permease PerM